MRYFRIQKRKGRSSFANPAGNKQFSERKRQPRRLG